MGLCFSIFQHLVSGTLNSTAYFVDFCPLLEELMTVRSLTLSLFQW